VATLSLDTNHNNNNVSQLDIGQVPDKSTIPLFRSRSTICRNALIERNSDEKWYKIKKIKKKQKNSVPERNAVLAPKLDLITSPACMEITIKCTLGQIDMLAPIGNEVESASSKSTMLDPRSLDPRFVATHSYREMVTKVKMDCG
jgi:hypothetical protein